MSKRAIVIVLDSVGVGALPDAELYGDKGSNTIGNISERVGGLKLKNLEKLKEYSDKLEKFISITRQFLLK